MRVALHVRLKLRPRQRVGVPSQGSNSSGSWARPPTSTTGPPTVDPTPESTDFPSRPRLGGTSLPAHAIDSALDRLEHLLERQRQFAYDASHLLRTPLAALRVQLEEALLYPDDADPHAALAGALCGAERLQAVVDDLLLLARQVTHEPALREDVDLSDLVRAETARRRPAARIRADVEQKITVFGERVLLTRLLNDLLDNAEDHFPATVEVKLFRRHGQAVLTVTGSRKSIPATDRRQAFESITRLDTSRSLDTRRGGLGLTIARDIAFVHDGTLLTDNGPSGARFVCRLPETGEVSTPRRPSPSRSIG